MTREKYSKNYSIANNPTKSNHDMIMQRRNKSDYTSKGDDSSNGSGDDSNSDDTTNENEDGV